MAKKTYNFNMNDIDNMFFSSKSATQDFEVIKTYLDRVNVEIKIEFVFYSAKLLQRHYLDTLQKLLKEKYGSRFEYQFAIDPSIPIIK